MEVAVACRATVDGVRSNAVTDAVGTRGAPRSDEPAGQAAGSSTTWRDGKLARIHHKSECNGSGCGLWSKPLRQSWWTPPRDSWTQLNGEASCGMGSRQGVDERRYDSSIINWLPTGNPNGNGLEWWSRFLSHRWRFGPPVTGNNGGFAPQRAEWAFHRTRQGLIAAAAGFVVETRQIERGFGKRRVATLSTGHGHESFSRQAMGYDGA